MGETDKLRSVEKTKLMIMVSLMAVIITICSWISIPMVVPFTLQTFAIFFALVFLGGAYGTLSIVIYILLGVIGVPVFSGLLFLLLTKIFGEKKTVIIISMVLGLIICYLIGTLWFMFVYAGTENAKGFGAVLSICVIPFIIPDICKMALAFILARIVKKAVK